jgi:hypothetical protein
VVSGQKKIISENWRENMVSPIYRVTKGEEMRLICPKCGIDYIRKLTTEWFHIYTHEEHELPDHDIGRGRTLREASEVTKACYILRKRTCPSLLERNTAERSAGVTNG